MVHALERIWEALRPGGLLVDVRPVAARWPLEILADGQGIRAGRVDDSPNVADDHAADTAIRTAVRRRFFRPIARATFPFDYVWDSVAEMSEYVTANWEGCAVLQPDLLERAYRLERGSHGEKRVRITMRMILRTYLRLEKRRV
jgi:hypothetical protein